MTSIAAAPGVLDLRDLEAELSRTKRKVLDWARNRQSVASDRRDLHQWTLQDQSDKLRQLHSHRVHLEAAAEQVQQRLAVERQDVEALQQACTSASMERVHEERSVSAIAQELSRQKEGYKQQIASLSYEERAKNKKMDALRNAVAMFEDRLGLQLQRSGGELHFHFTHIDAERPSSTYSFAVKIVTQGGQDTYTVTRCTPALSSLDTMQAQLNQHMDFGRFVKEIRRAFVSLSRSSLVDAA